MRLTTFTDYSLRVLVYLATGPAQRATIGQVAAAYQVSENHLVKVVHFLGRQGWLRNVRGKGGGLELALPPQRIVVGEVVRRTEGQAVAECFGATGGGCCIAPACRLRGVLGEALAAFHAVLDRYTLADLVAGAPQLAQLLFLPRPAAAGAGTSP
jgi:Rrf2 family transcriptional regulator, nitric oxide-sensitive transcriptional repressor